MFCYIDMLDPCANIALSPCIPYISWQPYPFGTPSVLTTPPSFAYLLYYYLYHWPHCYYLANFCHQFQIQFSDATHVPPHVVTRSWHPFRSTVLPCSWPWRPLSSKLPPHLPSSVSLLIHNDPLMYLQCYEQCYENVMFLRLLCDDAILFYPAPEL